MLHGVEWLAGKYSALSKASAANSSLVQAIETFSQRLAASSKAENQLQERRAAILSLKGLAKDHPLEVATHAGKALIDCLIKDVGAAPADQTGDDVAKSLIDCLVLVCTPPEQPQNKRQLRQAPATPATPALDLFLESSGPLHALLPLLAPGRTFYLRFSSLQLLALVLRHRKQLVQAHVLTSPGGCGAILECLSTISPTTGHSLGSSAEIIRNEALLLLPHLVDSNADIQKLIAFEGAFEKLLDVVAQEGRVEGGVVVQDALEALEALLRYNVSNQNYFRETLSIPLLAPLLFYPPPLPPNAPPHLATQRNEELERFAFQPWEYDGTDEFGEEGAGAEGGAGGDAAAGGKAAPNIVGDSQKLINAQLVVGIAGLLVQGTGEGKRANQNALLSTGFFHALLDLALGSSAPISLKTQSLHVLSLLLKQSRNVQDALGEASVSPVEPIKTQLAADVGAPAPRPSSESGSQDKEKAALAAAATAAGSSQGIIEYARLPPQSALVALINAALNGIPPPLRPIDGGYRSLLGFRAAAVKALQSILSDNIDARLYVVASMASSEQTRPEEQPGAVLLEALTTLPSNGQAEGFDEFKALFASIILGTVLKGAESVKDLARRLRYAPDGKIVLLPAEEDGEAKKSASDDDDDAASLLSVLIGNITVALRSQSEAVRTERSNSTGGATQGPTSVSWTRILLAHLTLLALWLHSSPNSVADLVSDSSNLQAVVQLVAEGANGEHLLVGMGTWVLGTIYEWGPAPREEGKEGGDSEALTRKEIHDLVTSRIGADQFQARLDRLRDDARLRLVGPDVLDKVGYRSSVDPIHAALVAPPVGQQDSIMVHLGLRKDAAAGGATSATTPAAAAPQEEDTPESAASSSHLWFDWSFAELYRHESSTISESILVPPTTTSAAASRSPTELVDAHRRIEQLTDQTKSLQHEVDTRGRLVTETLREVEELRSRVSELEAVGKGHEKTLNGLKDGHAQELEGLLDRHRVEMEVVKAAATRQGEGDSSALAAAREQVVALEQALEKRREEAQKEREEAVAQMRKEAEAEAEAKVAAASGSSAAAAGHEEESRKLKEQLDEAAKKHEAERKDLQEQVEALKKELAEQKEAAAAAAKAAAPPSAKEEVGDKTDASSSSARVAELEQENQDLLVMLDELSTKRKKDKAALKEKGVEVSEDEDEDDDDDE